MCGILTRYLGGYSTLVEEIEANTASDAPLNTLAREALAQTQQQELELKEMKRIEFRQRIVWMELLEAEVKRNRVETHHMQKEAALSLEKDKHLIKDCCLLRPNLMNCLPRKL